MDFRNEIIGTVSKNKLFILIFLNYKLLFWNLPTGLHAEGMQAGLEFDLSFWIFIHVWKYRIRGRI